MCKILPITGRELYDLAATLGTWAVGVPLWQSVVQQRSSAAVQQCSSASGAGTGRLVCGLGGLDDASRNLAAGNAGKQGSSRIQACDVKPVRSLLSHFWSWL